jgi:D-alanyl-D-alanine carboxypeptidase
MTNQTRPASRRPSSWGVVAWIAIAALLVQACGGIAPSASSSQGVVSAARSSAPASSASPSPAATPATPQALLDAVRQAYGAPGALALIRHGDQRTFLSSGTADTAGTPISDATRFRIASITKPMVAALVLDAVSRGEVKLDDVVGTLLPGVLRPKRAVTVRQLLDHTSGIFDESNGVHGQAEIEADVAKLTDPALRAEAEAAIQKLLAGQRAIASDRLIVALSETHERGFEPGSKFSYSNTNFQLAAMVLQRVTGKPIAELLKTRLAARLAVKGLSLAPPDLATPEFHGYGTSADGSLVDVSDDLSWFGNGGNGGVIATADDLVTVMQAIVGGKYLSADLTAAMLAPSQAGSYGLGMGHYSFTCGLVYGHQGGVNGTSSIAAASRDGRDGIVIAFNLRRESDPDDVSLAEDLLCWHP